MSALKEMTGNTFTSITIENESLTFNTENGKQYKMYQDSIRMQYADMEFRDGEFNDLIGNPILKAQSWSTQIDAEGSDDSDRLRDFEFETIKGIFTIRWVGFSGEDSSEDIRFEENHIIGMPYN